MGDVVLLQFDRKGTNKKEKKPTVLFLFDC